mmetsp:Transcript_121190/g.210736  ORF Transcript_121190/g.210736 Transcript_121190/m.210736 type:complete len:208 (+) Transcript_121190:478-1101(+)
MPQWLAMGPRWDTSDRKKSLNSKGSPRVRRHSQICNSGEMVGRISRWYVINPFGELTKPFISLALLALGLPARFFSNTSVILAVTVASGPLVTNRVARGTELADTKGLRDPLVSVKRMSNASMPPLLASLPGLVPGRSDSAASAILPETSAAVGFTFSVFLNLEGSQPMTNHGSLMTSSRVYRFAGSTTSNLEIKSFAPWEKYLAMR